MQPRFLVPVSTMVALLVACGGDASPDGGALAAAGGAAATGVEASASTGTGAGGEGRGGGGIAGSGPIVPTDAADNPDAYEDADDWNFPSDNYFVCGTLKTASAPLRYEDFSPIGDAGEYSVTNALDSDECGSGKVRFDLHEILKTTQGRLLFHKGGQGYDDPKTPYGHLWIADLESPAPSPQVGDEPPEYGTPSRIPGTSSWDASKRNGRGCDPAGDYDYHARIVHQGAPDELPADWQYKPGQKSSRYNKYADAGAEQAEGTAHHAYLLWSWLHRADGETTSAGGGQVRALIEDGQVFRRCPVDSIDSIAYAKGGTEEVGRVTAIYGKTRGSPDAPWVYGWTIHSHRARNVDGTYAPRVYHVSLCAPADCGA